MAAVKSPGSSGVGEIDIGIGISGVGGQGAAVMVDGQVGLAPAHVEEAEIAVGLQAGGIDLQLW